MSGRIVAVLVLALPVDVESTLLLWPRGLFVGQQQHEHLLALHFFFGDAVWVVA